MVHLIDADKLRAEIERRAQKCRDDGFGCHANALEDLLSFLDTLEEPDFPTTDEEIEEFLASHPKVEVPEKYKTPDWLYKKLDQEREVDLDFQRFAQEIQSTFALPASETQNSEENPLKWEYAIARHFYELGRGDRDTIFHKGMMYYRKQMMEEAVEGEVVQDLKGVNRVKSFGKIPERLYFGDKVRIIILKED